MKKILLSLLCLLLAFQANAQAFEPVAVEKNVTVKGQEGTIEFEMYIRLQLRLERISPDI